MCVLKSFHFFLAPLFFFAHSVAMQAIGHPLLIFHPILSLIVPLLHNRRDRWNNPAYILSTYLKANCIDWALWWKAYRSIFRQHGWIARCTEIPQTRNSWSQAFGISPGPLQFAVIRWCANAWTTNNQTNDQHYWAAILIWPIVQNNRHSLVRP